MTTNEKIAALRAAAKAAGADGVLIMTSDPHCSEYLPGYYNALPWFSGFIGENSTLVVTQDRSALWCDGRFYVQADKQLAGSEIECMHAGSAGVPTVAEYLESHFADGQTLLLDGSCVPATIAEEYRDALAKKGAALKSLDVASPIWDATGERPALPDTPCNLLLGSLLMILSAILMFVDDIKGFLFQLLILVHGFAVFSKTWIPMLQFFLNKVRRKRVI